MADFRAVSSLSMAVVLPDTHMPSRRVVLVEMAAGIAEMGSLAVPCWTVTCGLASTSFLRQHS